MSIKTEFGSKVRFKKEYEYTDLMTFESSDVFQVAHYKHKLCVQLHHPRMPELVRIEYRDIDELLEDVDDE